MSQKKPIAPNERPIALRDGDHIYMLAFKPEGEPPFIELDVYDDGVALSGRNQTKNINMPLTSMHDKHTFTRLGLVFLTRDEVEHYVAHEKIEGPAFTPADPREVRP